MPDFSTFHGEIALMYTKAIIAHLKKNYIQFATVGAMELLGYAIDLNFPEGTTLSTMLHFTSRVGAQALILSAFLEINRPVEISFPEINRLVDIDTTDDHGIPLNSYRASAA
ncbi:TPA: hypothetical protein ACTXXA_001030 [Legionella anisa]